MRKPTVFLLVFVLVKMRSLIYVLQFRICTGHLYEYLQYVISSYVIYTSYIAALPLGQLLDVIRQLPYYPDPT